MPKPLKSNKKELTREQREQLFRILKARFEKNMNCHKKLEWTQVQARLDASPEKLWSLSEMEQTGGEPDVLDHDKKTGEYIFLRLLGGKSQSPQKSLLRPCSVGVKKRK